MLITFWLIKISEWCTMFRPPIHLFATVLILVYWNHSCFNRWTWFCLPGCLLWHVTCSLNSLHFGMRPEIRGDRLTWLELVGMQHLCICAAGLEYKCFIFISAVKIPFITQRLQWGLGMAWGSLHFPPWESYNQRWDPLMMHGCGRFIGLVNYS